MPILVNNETIDESAIAAEAERMRPQFERVFADEEPESRERRLQAWARENPRPTKRPFDARSSWT